MAPESQPWDFMELVETFTGDAWKTWQANHIDWSTMAQNIVICHQHLFLSHCTGTSQYIEGDL